MIYFNEKGQLHCTTGPAIIHPNKDKEWFVGGKRHREDGPAIEFVSGFKSWWYMGKRHRTDGPAVERCDGTKAWYINNKEYTEHQFNDQKLKQQLIPPEMWVI